MKSGQTSYTSRWNIFYLGDSKIYFNLNEPTETILPKYGSARISYELEIYFTKYFIPNKKGLSNLKHTSLSPTRKIFRPN